jgi:hypothetical protein
MAIWPHPNGDPQRTEARRFLESAGLIQLCRKCPEIAMDSTADEPSDRPRKSIHMACARQMTLPKPRRCLVSPNLKRNILKDDGLAAERQQRTEKHPARDQLAD